MSGYRIILEAGPRKNAPEPMWPDDLTKFANPDNTNCGCFHTDGAEVHVVDRYRDFEVKVLDSCGTVIKKVKIDFWELLK